ncbi:MAG: type I glyceraldehyde-3-phosphate dehydrogenase, partial [Acidimicrobiia bacterium]|nr:type I glyceraldehyde-3-phosphate dehydrogenase [Acidimicrobiia bacterium]
GKMSAAALNVPVTDGSTVDMVTEIEGSATVEEVNAAIQSAIAEYYTGVIEYVADPIVSSDVRMEPYSGIYDSLATMVTGGNLVKTITWFNNGWGYSHRVVEVVSAISKFLEGDE